MIGKLYRIGAMARKKVLSDGLTEIELIYQWRQEKSRPILDVLHAWLVKNQKEVMPQSLIGQWLYIYRYIDDDAYAIDNNVIEREIRSFATARKAWFFSDCVPVANASAVIYSMMLTCCACNVESYAWLCHVLSELPKRQAGDDVTDLLPFNYARR